MSERNVKKLAKKLQLPIKRVLVRGGTSHRKDLWLEDGTILHYWPDGEFTAHTLCDVSRIWNNTQIIDGKDPEIPNECRQ